MERGRFMTWREAFLIRFGPGMFGGVTLPLWLKMLRENHFSVDPPYWGRAAMVTSSSVSNAAKAWLEDLIHGAKVARTPIAPPLFILGIWRSGTTHLHNLLTRDDRYAYPNNYQTCFPRTFLTTEWFQAAFVDAFMPNHRPQDNMTMGMRDPQEEEFALCALTGHSFIMSWAFPRSAADYGRFLTLRRTSDAEVAEWKSAMAGFLRKLSYKYGKPLILKSPGNTCRIRRLLEVFPDARFVHIHRDPFAVHQSTQHMLRSVLPWVALQKPDLDNLSERCIRDYKEVYDAFFEERSLIPKGRFHEIGFEDLEREPIKQLRHLYAALDLPDFATAEPAITRYLESLGHYKKNVFPEMDEGTRKRLGREYQRCFEEWGYPMAS
jgi:omega-hydroxy-beta-dihydromenaquinone-9 sulfotransferase